MKISRRENVDDSALNDLVPDPVLRQLLARRGVSSEDELNCKMAGLLHYGTLKDIGRAASLIAAAVKDDVPIMVAGDYDVDGLTGTSIGFRGLKALGATRVSYFVPSRYDGGYGLSPEQVQGFYDAGIRFILTVDNGITCFEAVEKARGLNMTVVVTDHHEVSDRLPAAHAVVDPKQPDDAFPSKALCGAGVLFYVLIATRAKLKEQGFFAGKAEPRLEEFLDLVALGTIGDVVPLDTNNRRLIKAGIGRIRRGLGHVGLAALAAKSGVDAGAITVQNISFDLCPRLNAAGRIKLPDNPAADLLMTDDPRAAQDLAVRLDMCNHRRGDYERVALKEALEDAEAYRGDPCIVLFRPQWLPGIIGLIAGKLKEEFQVPCLVFTGEEELISCSARSVPGVSLSDLFTEIHAEHPELLTRFGGHAMAAGAAVRRSDLDKLREILCEKIRSSGAVGEYEIISDGSLPPNYATVDFARDLEEAGPWGNGFPEPQFDGIFTVTAADIVGGRHLRLTLKDDSGSRLQAIRFRASDSEKALRKGLKVRLVYTLGVDRYLSRDRLTVKVEAVEAV